MLSSNGGGSACVCVFEPWETLWLAGTHAILQMGSPSTFSHTSRDVLEENSASIEKGGGREDTKRQREKRNRRGGGGKGRSAEPETPSQERVIIWEHAPGKGRGIHLLISIGQPTPHVLRGSAAKPQEKKEAAGDG